MRRVLACLCISLLIVFSSCDKLQLLRGTKPNPVPIPPPAMKAIGPVRYIVADSHFHYVDFLQQTDGIEALLKAMDRCGVEQTFICGMPLVKKWHQDDPRKPLYYLHNDSRAYWYSLTDVIVARAVLSLPEKDRKRFHPFICGFNGTDRNAVDHVRRMLKWYPDFWAGIGEVMARHDDLTALTYGETPRADHVALDPIYELAAENDLPVGVHSNIGSVWLREPIYIHEMENAVKRHPETRFIWNHAGISRRIKVPTITKELRRMLRTYENLWVDISWVVFEDYVAPQGKPSPEWVALIEEFPDRFMFGTDKVARWGNLPEEVMKYYVLYDALKPETAKMVARDNFLRVLPRRVREKQASLIRSPVRSPVRAR
jgi:predicted TIM-barrel fold metal-dependent hydrolase